eukprot:CAMPEP_0174725270 /NCGR_PEP_ID=MMETSP1094-20130205/45188_1 /TAXON_ID=156173 /ORGANISM="Chrysochromulina brevifilum, Strain UTEX LB 985" /LENGTH=35 /DNA_ID= /DNA_START= /DNA_END= /DNA_ORIENTATION=
MVRGNESKPAEPMRQLSHNPRESQLQQLGACCAYK